MGKAEVDVIEDLEVLDDVVADVLVVLIIVGFVLLISVNKKHNRYICGIIYKGSLQSLIQCDKHIEPVVHSSVMLKLNTLDACVCLFKTH